MNQALSLENPGTSGVFFDKRLGTNLVAAALVGGGLWFNGPWRETLLNTGLFALSGAITNWLAIYMLFERVPGLYGSGVIPLHFEDFKTGINELIMHQFFNRENVEKFFANSSGLKIFPDFEAVFKKVNLNPAFDSLLEVIENSSFGPILSMVGGVQLWNLCANLLRKSCRLQYRKFRKPNLLKKHYVNNWLTFLQVMTFCKKLKTLFLNAWMSSHQTW